MPVAGRKPKSPGQARNRNTPVHDWTEVEDVPYEGTPPVEPPESRPLVDKDGAVLELPLHPQARAWWDGVRRMPHCVLWSDSDWRFAADTALVADAFYYGRTSAAVELRQREKILGTTVDSRRDLRIRYVEPAPELAEDAGVTHLDDYRDL
jgi:hypothetical protein